jgi:hypothetical protein
MCSHGSTNAAGTYHRSQYVPERVCVRMHCKLDLSILLTPVLETWFSLSQNRTFECKRLEGTEYTSAANRFKYDEPSTSVTNSDGKWFFRLSGRGIQGAPIMWQCPTQTAANNLKDYADKVKEASLFYQNGDEDCTEDRIPPILQIPPKDTPTPDPVGPKCGDVGHLGVCKQLPTGTCYIQAASEGKCTEIEYVMQGAVGTKVAIYDDIIDWFSACVGGFDCSLKQDANPGKLTYVENPDFSSYPKSGKWWFEFDDRKSGGKSTLEGNKILYECTKEGSFLAKEVSMVLVGCFLIHRNMSQSVRLYSSTQIELSLHFSCTCL